MFLSRAWLQKNMKCIPLDFTKPWWSLITSQKLLFSTIMILTTITNLFWSISPFLIAYVFKSQNIKLCIILCIVWAIIDCLYTYAHQLNITFQLQCIHSIYESAHQYLLTADPHYHIHRSSGALLGKIDRAARGYEEILDQITFEFIPLLVGIMSMIIALSYYSFLLTSIVGLFFVAMIVGGYYCAIYFCQPWERDFLKTDDAFRATAVENLAQVQMVRAAFASDYMSNKLMKRINANMVTEGKVWLSYVAGKFILNIAYLITVFCLMGLLFWQIEAGITTIASALSLFVAYLRSTKDLVNIMKPFRRYMRGLTAVTNLFDFIPTFGKETYPVLGPVHAVLNKNHTIALEARSISFDYETARLFNNHTFLLTCFAQQKNKLYGIIGPSGSGKTTLLSILGGQLKPNVGTVSINGTDIYAVNDATRRQLITLQGQVATSVRGTVKYNMLFGLPESHGYTDEYLIHILERVGLRTILAAHHGLSTMLGEGGLNLSGGQRQRLNFAGLYLRAYYYKPLLILIDEPTSSLDELSEAAITQMIVELACNAVTLVIAHRLKTVEQAVGLVDLSLLAQEKNIIPYQAEELAHHSVYYKKLLQGKAHLDADEE